MKNVLLIGLGMVADTHVAAIMDSPKTRLHAICGRDKARAERYAEQVRAHHGVRPQVYGSVAEALGDTRIDFAILATPPDARREIIAGLAAARLPVLMEKPVERSLGAARSIVSLCEGKMPLGIVFQHRFRAASEALQGLMPKLGAVQTAQITVPWWRDQGYYDAPGRGTFARDGGGVMMNQAIHTLDLMLSLTGPVAKVQAMARTSRTHRMEAEDIVTAGLKFASGAVGSFYASTAHYPGLPEEIVLHCDNGSAVLGSGLLKISWRDGRVETIGEEASTGGGADPMAFTHAWHQSVIEDFADALEEDRPPRVTGAEALKTHALIEALTRSSREGRICEVDHV